MPQSRGSFVSRILPVRTLAVAVALCAVAHAAEAKTFAWKATKGSGVVYLIGSIHVLTPDFYPLDPALEAAFKDSDLLVEEVDMAEMLDPTAQLRVLSRGMLPGDQSLDKLLSPATLALVKKVTGDLGAGRPAADALQAVDAGDRAAGARAAEGGLRPRARPRQAFLRSGEDRRQSRPGPRDRRLSDLASSTG